MRAMRPAVSLVILFTLALGLVLPALVTGFAQLAFPFSANGSLIARHGQPIGSARIGQAITGPGWFVPRPSALTGTAPDGRSIATPYDAAQSGASNLAPTSTALAAHVAARIAAWHATFGAGPVPDDAVTSSGSGLDPDISLANALRQAPVVAAARHLPPDTVIALVRRLAARPWLGLIGTAHVNVLRLDIALARAAAR